MECVFKITVEPNQKSGIERYQKIPKHLENNNKKNHFYIIFWSKVIPKEIKKNVKLNENTTYKNLWETAEV